MILRNLPQDVNVKVMSDRIKFVFSRIFSDSKIIQAKAIGKLDKLYKMAVKLREYKRDKAYYRMLNKKRKEHGDEERIKIKLWNGWCKSKRLEDAENYYKGMIKS